VFKLIHRFSSSAADWVLVPILRRQMRRLSRSMLERTLEAKLKLAVTLMAGAAIVTLASRLAGLHAGTTHVYLIVALPAISAIKMSASVAKLRDPILRLTRRDGLAKRIGFAVFMGLPGWLRLAAVKKVARTAARTAVTDYPTLSFAARYALVLVVWKVAVRFAVG